MEEKIIEFLGLTKRAAYIDGFRQKLLKKKINSFQPKVVFKDQINEFEIKTAVDPADLQKVLELRHDVFVKDLSRRSRVLNVDFDRYDLLGDHIMITDTTNDTVIGTYRIISSQFSDKFYSATEFHINSFLAEPDHKVELGRACVHSSFRKGIILHLIWRGIAQYLKLVNARYVFGCSSIFTTDENCLGNILNSFSSENWGKEFLIAPRRKYKFDNMFSIDPGQKISESESHLVPALLKSYMKVGAKVYGQPALDRDFRCADIFTVLDIGEMSPKYYKKYFGCISNEGH